MIKKRGVLRGACGGSETNHPQSNILPNRELQSLQYVAVCIFLYYMRTRAHARMMVQWYQAESPQHHADGPFTSLSDIRRRACACGASAARGRRHLGNRPQTLRSAGRWAS